MVWLNDAKFEIVDSLILGQGAGMGHPPDEPTNSL
jgi:hypothetical protein